MFDAEEVGSSEKPVPIYQATRRHFPEGRHLGTPPWGKGKILTFIEGIHSPASYDALPTEGHLIEGVILNLRYLLHLG
jgi:hypothetical protein